MFAAGPQLKNIPWWGKNILRGGGANARLQKKYTKYNQINCNAENLRGVRLLPGGLLSPVPHSFGPSSQ